eukprot:1158508-Pelagomonas_calceolata.AAC.43
MGRGLRVSGRHCTSRCLLPACSRPEHVPEFRVGPVCMPKVKERLGSWNRGIGQGLHQPLLAACLQQEA